MGITESIGSVLCYFVVHITVADMGLSCYEQSAGVVNSLVKRIVRDVCR